MNEVIIYAMLTAATHEAYFIFAPPHAREDRDGR